MLTAALHCAVEAPSLFIRCRSGQPEVASNVRPRLGPALGLPCPQWPAVSSVQFWLLPLLHDQVMSSVP